MVTLWLVKPCVSTRGQASTGVSPALHSFGLSACVSDFTISSAQQTELNLPLFSKLHCLLEVFPKTNITISNAQRSIKCQHELESYIWSVSFTIVGNGWFHDFYCLAQLNIFLASVIMFLIRCTDFNQVFCLFNWVKWYFFVFSSRRLSITLNFLLHSGFLSMELPKQTQTPLLPSQSHQMQTVQLKNWTIYPIVSRFISKHWNLNIITLNNLIVLLMSPVFQILLQNV